MTNNGPLLTDVDTSPYKLVLGQGAAASPGLKALVDLSASSGVTNRMSSLT